MGTQRAKYAPQPRSDRRASSLELVPGVVVGGKYRLLRPAGFGGMGAVWVARNNATGAEVAVKVLLTREDTNDEADARFRREAYAAAKLSHRGIVRIFDLVELEGEHAGVLVMVMELLRGETLAELLERRAAEGNARLELVEALEIALALLSALAHAHAAGVVHRDVKPENVFLSADPDGHVTPKLLDFGISVVRSPEAPRITSDGALLGTPAYMSPEQARGTADLDARSDVFAMGILLYEMLAGANPFMSGSYHSVVAAILECEPRPLPAVPPAIAEVVVKALEKKPENRYASADEFAMALRAAAGPLVPAHSRPSFPPARTSSDPRLSPLPPPRRSLPTIPDEYGVARRQRRARTVGILLGVALALGVAAVVALRASLSPSAPASPPAAVEPSVVAPAISRAPYVPAPEVQVEALPMASSAAPPRVASPRAAPPRRTPRAAAPTSSPTPPAASPAKDPAADPPSPPSGVVRDPGF